jgi:ArsR family transcriptional regulator
MGDNHTEQARLFKAFCDENRLMILERLKSGETCACHLLEDLSISQSTLSHHMGVLCEAGVVSARKDGKWTYYSIDVEGSKQAVELLQQITRRNDFYPSDMCV